jgi:hypothetical protein
MNRIGPAAGTGLSQVALRVTVLHQRPAFAPAQSCKSCVEELGRAPELELVGTCSWRPVRGVLRC